MLILPLLAIIFKLYKKLNHRSFLSKAGYFLIFSIVFFIQLQSKFIEASNEYSSKRTSHSSHASFRFKFNAEGSIKVAFVKPSKRFELNSTFVLLPKFIIA